MIIKDLYYCLLINYKEITVTGLRSTVYTVSNMKESSVQLKICLQSVNNKHKKKEV